MFGSGRATLSLRSSYQRDLREVKGATGFGYVRFHGIFDDDTGLYSVGADGKPIWNYSYIDQIYDRLLEQGVRPFVELDFMPKQLASTGEDLGFWYQALISPPKSWDAWGDLVQEFAQHLVNRYGIDEVARWYFEVWNEPNGDLATAHPRLAYYRLYDGAARALKRVSPRLRVGGPATMRAAWIPGFIRHCDSEHIPIDFVSTHVYGSDDPKGVFGEARKIGIKEMVSEAVRMVHAQVKASAHPGLPIIFSEYNASSNQQSDVTDAAFMGPWLANTIRQSDGQVDMMSYWTFSDVFEEQGVVKKPFYGGYGLVAEDGIHKAAFNDFALLHKLGTERLATGGDSAIVTRRPDGNLAVAVWNYAAPGNHGSAKRFDILFEHIVAGEQAAIWIVDEHHGSPLSTWKAMGSPAFPTREQINILRSAGRLPPPEILLLSARRSLSLELEPHSLALIELSPQAGRRIGRESTGR